MLTAGFIKTLSSSASGLRRLATSLANIARNRAALNQLSKLDEKTLADIGLTRGDIVSANALPLRKDPFLIDPFEARRRVHSSELDALARWPRPLPEQPYVAGRSTRRTDVCIAAE
ncbi:protein of unknown function [Cohaesibacter sp. ES.047]|uniref:DUF1127 domain-containing protein n=1 Tax=Cohaesibacter sp. ES.047 TaxID=1798205 RepID=UPI000BB89B4D|nr:DUF1127 domain-containing protein [Cohaesibacter sp. ES.047]SNY92073.1 protein of unknown function [Cohaesibacter sp. ES.047]